MIIESERIHASRSFELCPEGWCEAILADVLDLGEVHSQYGTKLGIRFIWFTNLIDSTGKPFRLLQQFNVSSHPKSNLMRAVEEILGHPPTLPLDTEQLIGSRAKVRVRHITTATTFKRYANIVAIAPSETNSAVIPSWFARGARQ